MTVTPPLSAKTDLDLLSVLPVDEHCVWSGEVLADSPSLERTQALFRLLRAGLAALEGGRLVATPAGEHVLSNRDLAGDSSR